MKHGAATAWLVVIVAVITLFAGLPRASAQGLESVFSPGALIEGHAKLEAKCDSCHVRFNRDAQDALCLGCHEAVGRDLAQRRGLHGKSTREACRSCHTDHKGRGARIAVIDEARFDHRATDFALEGRHRDARCAACHRPATKRRDTPSDCVACHRQDDRHAGGLGPACASCHVASSWRETRFDHDTTRFRLTGGHRAVKCASCHVGNRFKGTSQTCIGCHRKDDKHEDRFGARCESCHATERWGAVRFDHDRDTRYRLVGRHREARCESCHTAPVARLKPATTCVACHAKDDRHRGSLGTDCGSCHTETRWKDPPRFDHARTRFPLLGSHARARCESCHATADFKQAPRECVGCHRKDDKHLGNVGAACGDCHAERRWREAPRFDHARTRFPLANAHASPGLGCKACHAAPDRMRGTPTACIACHRKDDAHAGQQGVACESCHDDRSWKGARFDHARSRFPLTGRHLSVACESCHADRRFKGVPTDCASCHRKDDVHRATLGTRCEACHGARAWAAWTFDHDRKTGFRLDGAHLRARCAACHRAPAPATKLTAPLAPACASCHQRQDAHDGRFGNNCERCHDTGDWRRVHAPGTAGAPPWSGAGAGR
ncbi:MAG: cytochrome c3 family protein [Lautropia sp.]